MVAKKCATKRDARAKLLFCIVKLLLFFISCVTPPHLKLPVIYDTLWSVGKKQNFLSANWIASADSIRNVFRLISSSFDWLGKLRERTGQLWRDNSRRVRTHENNSGEPVHRLDTIIHCQSFFWAESGASIRLTVWKWSCESPYPGALRPMLENFRRAFSPGPTDGDKETCSNTSILSLRVLGARLETC